MSTPGDVRLDIQPGESVEEFTSAPGALVVEAAAVTSRLGATWM